MSGLNRFDESLRAWALAYPTVTRDRRAVNVLLCVVSLAMVASLVVHAVRGSLTQDHAASGFLFLFGLVGLQAIANVIFGLTRSVQSLGPQAGGSGGETVGPRSPDLVVVRKGSLLVVLASRSDRGRDWIERLVVAPWQRYADTVTLHPSDFRGRQWLAKADTVTAQAPPRDWNWFAEQVTAAGLVMVTADEDQPLCGCGSGLPGRWARDAQGVELAWVCNACETESLARFPPDVLSDARWLADCDLMRRWSPGAW